MEYPKWVYKSVNDDGEPQDGVVVDDADQELELLEKWAKPGPGRPRKAAKPADDEAV